MGLHPTAAGSTDDCILCGSCIRHCPHDAICFNLRYPWLGLKERPDASWAMACFAPAVLVILFWQGISGEILAGMWLLPVYLIGLILLFPGGRGGWVEQSKSLGISLLPLAFAGLFIFFFRQSLAHGAGLLQPLFDLLSPADAGRVVDLRILGLLPVLIACGAAYLSWRIFRLQGGRLVTLAQKSAAVGMLLVFLLFSAIGI